MSTNPQDRSDDKGTPTQEDTEGHSVRWSQPTPEEDTEGHRYSGV